MISAILKETVATQALAAAFAGRFDGGASSETAAAALAPQSAARTVRFLILGVDPETRGLVLELLAGGNYEVICGDSAEQLEDLTEDKPPFDAVLLSCRESMEGLSSLVSLIRSKCAETLIIVLACPPAEVFWAEAVHIGAYEWLNSPIDRVELERVLFNVTERVQLPKESWLGKVSPHQSDTEH